MAGAVVGKGADRRSNGVRVCSVADRELNIVFCDEGRGRRLVVDGQGDEFDAQSVQLRLVRGEIRQLGRAEGAPGPTIDEHDAERTRKCVGKREGPTANVRGCNLGKRSPFLSWATLNLQENGLIGPVYG
jgi:hypothetical protein